MATIEDFMKLDIRVGKIIDAKIFEKAKRPAYQLKIDFGSEIGVKKSSAQITEVYKLEEYKLRRGVNIIFLYKKNVTVCDTDFHCIYDDFCTCLKEIELYEN